MFLNYPTHSSAKFMHQKSKLSVNGYSNTYRCNLLAQCFKDIFLGTRDPISGHYFDERRTSKRTEDQVKGRGWRSQIGRNESLESA